MGELMELPVNYVLLTQPMRRQVREEYVRRQSGNCHYCKQPLKDPAPENIQRKPIKRSLFPPSFFEYPVHLHHSHVTGMTIGAVHNHCNAVLWQWEGE